MLTLARGFHNAGLLAGKEPPLNGYMLKLSCLRWCDVFDGVLGLWAWCVSLFVAFRPLCLHDMCTCRPVCPLTCMLLLFSSVLCHVN